jgi:hypothetical protein
MTEQQRVVLTKDGVQYDCLAEDRIFAAEKIEQGYVITAIYWAQESRSRAYTEPASA